MGSGYEIVEQELDASRGISILVLGKVGEDDTFIDLLARDPRRKAMAAAIARAALRLAERGTSWALGCQVIKRLSVPKGSLAVYELKAGRTRFRVMTYLHDDAAKTPVLLFEFMGHQGASHGGIREKTLKRGVKLAGIARELMERRDAENG